MAQLRSPDRLRTRPMMEVDRTYVGHRKTDAFDTTRTWDASPSCVKAWKSGVGQFDVNLIHYKGERCWNRKPRRPGAAAR